MEKYIFIQNDSGTLSNEFIDHVTKEANMIKYEITNIGYSYNGAILYYNDNVMSSKPITQIYIHRNIIDNENIVNFRYTVYDIIDMYREKNMYNVSSYVDDNIGIISLLNSVNEVEESKKYYALKYESNFVCVYDSLNKEAIYDSNTMLTFDNLDEAKSVRDILNTRYNHKVEILEFSFNEIN